MSSKQEMEICLEPESNLVPSAREPGLPGCQYFYQVDVGGRGDIRGVQCTLYNATLKLPVAIQLILCP